MSVKDLFLHQLLPDELSVAAIEDLFCVLIESGLVPSRAGTRVLYSIERPVFPLMYILGGVAGGSDKVYARNFFSDLWRLFAPLATPLQTHGLFENLYADSDDFQVSKDLARSFEEWSDEVVRETFLSSLCTGVGTYALISAIQRRLFPMLADLIRDIVAVGKRRFRPLAPETISLIQQRCHGRNSRPFRSARCFFAAYSLITDHIIGFQRWFGFMNATEIAPFVLASLEAGNQPLAVRLFDWAQANEMSLYPFYEAQSFEYIAMLDAVDKLEAPVTADLRVRLRAFSHIKVPPSLQPKLHSLSFFIDSPEPMTVF
jgi:hypothetical protein